MKISFHGATRTVTGSKHLLHIAPSKKILLDCGMFQGMGADTFMLNSSWGFNPAELNYVIISHAHIDHVGLLPKLVKDGYKGRIYCTPQTLELAKVLMLDSAFIQESDIAHVNKMRKKQGRPSEKALYTEEDVKKVFPLMVSVPFDVVFKIDDDLELLYTGCGHIVGAAAVNLKIREHGLFTNLTFSGDVGRFNEMILKPPVPFPQADIIIMESTYGNKEHDIVTPAVEKLLHFITDTCLKKRGKLIIPAFSVGRTQEILLLLNQLENERRLPSLDYFVDSPLSIEATEILKRHPECFNDNLHELMRKDHDIFSFKGLKYLHTAQESKALNTHAEPCVIISASGMGEAGRVKHHIQNNIDSRRNTILIVGYCEPHSLGGRLRSGAKHVSIYGTQHFVEAEVGVIENLSAHADFPDLCRWLSCQDTGKVKNLFLVHGEYDVQQEFRQRLLYKGFSNIGIPNLHDEVNFIA